MQVSLLNPKSGKVPQGLNFVFALFRPLPKSSQVDDAELPPHPTAESSKASPKAMRRMAVLPFSRMADASRRRLERPEGQQQKSRDTTWLPIECPCRAGVRRSPARTDPAARKDRPHEEIGRASWRERGRVMGRAG